MNAKEAEVDQFCEDLQNLLELMLKKKKKKLFLSCMCAKFPSVSSDSIQPYGGHRVVHHTGVAGHALLQGNLPCPAIEPTFPRTPTLTGRFFTTNTTWDAPFNHRGI